MDADYFLCAANPQGTREKHNIPVIADIGTVQRCDKGKRILIMSSLQGIKLYLVKQ